MTSDHSGFVYEVGAADPALYGACLNFVREQSCGEWGDDIERQDAAKLVAFVQTLRAAPTPAEPSHLRSAAAALIAKLDECQPGIVGLAAFAAAHHYGYSGPTYHAEHEALRAALETPAEPSEEEVERVARAVLAELGSGAAEFAAWADFPKSPSRDDLEETRYDGAFSPNAVARAAIAALRAPSGRVEKEVG